MIDVLKKLRYLLSRREQWQAGLLFLLMLAGAMLEMLGVGAIPAFVSLLSNPDLILQYDAAQAVYEALDIRTEQKFAMYAAGALVVIYLVKNVYLGGLAYAQARYIRNRQVTIAKRLFGAYLHSPYTFHLQRNTAELLRNTNAETRRIADGILQPGLRIIKEVLVITAILALLLYAEPLISAVTFFGLGGTVVLFYRSIRRRLTTFGKQQQDGQGKMIQAVNEGLGSLKDTRVLGREKHFVNAFTHNARQYAQAAKFRTVMQALPRLFLETAAMVGLLAVAALLLTQGRSVASIIPTLTLLAVAVVRLIPSFNRLTSDVSSLRYGSHAINAVHGDLVELEGVSAQGGSAEELFPFERALRLDHVHYRYPGADEDALTDISLEIPNGSAVGFVGPTGAGKTTIVDVILGLLTPTEGAVRVDGQDVNADPPRWQRRIGYIPQDIYLADTTIRSNIALGLPEAEIDDEALRRSVQAAQLDELIGQLSNGLETTVGDRGVRLSGGQRQRIGIARALYHNPDVLVMDEATSSLDNATERNVMEAVEHARGERTLIMIAHRLSTVENCDRLFFLRDGQLDAAGTYDELLETSGDFRQMAAV